MVTDKQIAALKYLIAIAKDGSPTVKRIMFFLLDQSERLTEEVCVTLTQDREGYSREEIQRDALAMRGLVSCNRTTHIHEVMAVTGTEFNFDVHYGHFNEDGEFDSSGMFPGAPKHTVADERLTILDAPRRYTYWLAPGFYSKTARVTPVTRHELEMINLSKPGLYRSESELLAG